MKERFDQRFTELLSDGQKLLASIPRAKYGLNYWIPEERIAEYQRWLGSVVNLIRLIDKPGGTFVVESERVMKDQDLKRGIPSRVVQKMHGLLAAAQDEWQQGFLRKIEHIIVEDTIKRIARKHNIETKGLSLEPLIDEIVKVGAFTPVKAKRVKGFAGVRNHALHAEWNEFDIRDVGELINGTRELIDNFLQ